MALISPDRLLWLRRDEIGTLTRQKHTLDLITETLVDGWDDQAPEWWRDRADRVDELGEHELADRLRSVAALIEEAYL